MDLIRLSRIARLPLRPASGGVRLLVRRLFLRIPDCDRRCSIHTGLCPGQIIPILVLGRRPRRLLVHIRRRNSR